MLPWPLPKAAKDPVDFEISLSLLSSWLEPCKFSSSFRFLATGHRSPLPLHFSCLLPTTFSHHPGGCASPLHLSNAEVTCLRVTGLREGLQDFILGQSSRILSGQTWLITHQMSHDIMWGLTVTSCLGPVETKWAFFQTTPKDSRRASPPIIAAFTLSSCLVWGLLYHILPSTVPFPGSPVAKSCVAPKSQLCSQDLTENFLDCVSKRSTSLSALTLSLDITLISSP